MSSHLAARVARQRPWIYFAAAAFVACIATLAGACPFCGTPQQTLSEELENAQAAVFASLVEPMPDPAENADDALPDEGLDSTAVFEVTEVVRGGGEIEPGQKIEVVYFGQDDRDKRFLITSFPGDRLDWSTPIPLSEAAQEYVRKLSDVPEEGADRLDFFEDYFEHEDRLLAQDAYDEFARAPYEDVIALGDRINRPKLLQWIDDPNVGPSNRRLYLTLLGVCGTSEDVPMLRRLLNFDRELIDPGVATVAAAMHATGTSLGAGVIDELVRAEEQRKKQSLDALIACYLKLEGPPGLELINRLFLGNPNVEYTHLHSAIMALRFHGEEADVLPRSELLKSMRLALDHPDFADQVVPDLARWEDWDVMPRLINMFRNATSDSWIRQPVASYLLVAAQQSGEVGEQARSALDELEQLDPETMKRARTLSAFTLLSGGKPRGGAAEQSDGSAEKNDDDADSNLAGEPEQPEDGDPESGEQAATQVAAATSEDADADSTTGAGPSLQAANDAPAQPADGTAAPQDNRSTADNGAGDGATAPADLAVADSASEATPGLTAPATAQTTPMPRTFSRYTLLGVLLLAALILLAVFAVLIRGADPRLPNSPGEADARQRE